MLLIKEDIKFELESELMPNLLSQLEHFLRKHTKEILSEVEIVKRRGLEYKPVV